MPFRSLRPCYAADCERSKSRCDQTLLSARSQASRANCLKCLSGRGPSCPQPISSRPRIVAPNSPCRREARRSFWLQRATAGCPSYLESRLRRSCSRRSTPALNWSNFSRRNPAAAFARSHRSMGRFQPRGSVRRAVSRRSMPEAIWLCHSYPLSVAPGSRVRHTSPLGTGLRSSSPRERASHCDRRRNVPRLRLPPDRTFSTPCPG